jgi:hypothetical protein
MVPVVLTTWKATGQSEARSFILDESAMTVDLPPDTTAYKLNAGQTGFYRVHYEDTDNLAALGDMVRSGGLADSDRWGLQNDLYALVRAGRLSLDVYIDFLAAYEEESAYLPMVSIVSNLQHACGVMPEERRRGIMQTGRTLAEYALSRIGMAPDQEEPHTRAALRNQLLFQAAAWGSTSAADFAVDAFEKMMAGQGVPADIARSVMQVGALKKGEAALKWFKRRFFESPSEHERMNILAGMVAFDRWELIEAALAFALESVPPRNRFIPIASAGSNPVAAPHLWAWYRSHLPELEAFHPLLYERVITGIVPLGGLGNEADIHTFFDGYLNTRPHLKDAAELALEYMEINAKMRVR